MRACTRRQKWCILSDIDATDFGPGYRMNGLLSGTQYCCRHKGTVSGDGTVCEVGGSCDTVPTLFNVFVSDPLSADCYAE